MNFVTAQPKTAQQIRARLTSNERIELMIASEDRIEFMRQTTFAGDMPSKEVMVDLVKLVTADWNTRSNSHFGVTL